MDNKPADSGLAGLVNLLVPSREALAESHKREAEDKAYEAYCYRRLDRFRQWAMKQDKEALADHLSLAALLLIEKKKTDRERMRKDEVSSRLIDALGLESRIANAREAAARDVAKEYMGKSLAHDAARKRGAVSRLANDKDGKQAAKAGALALWKERQAGQHPRLRTVEQFAVEVCRRWPVIATVDTPRKWAAAWKREYASAS